MPKKNILEHTEEINKLKQEIAGEIAVASNVSNVLKKWQNIFEISQKTLAREMKITSSTLSDYENERRQNPSIQFVLKFVNALINTDAKHNAHILKKLISVQSLNGFETKEFKKAIKIRHTEGLKEFVQINTKNPNEPMYGITIIEQEYLQNTEFQDTGKLFGKTNKRIFYFCSARNLELIAMFLHALKSIASQNPSAIVLELSEAEKENCQKIIDTNLPLFITQKTKEEIKTIVKDL